MYEPTWESVSTHSVPDWYHDVKLGIFLHWGLYSVPGWAPQVANIQEMLRKGGPAYVMKNNPYAEWYLNSMQIKGSPTRRHHIETYGPDFTYDDFIDEFDRESRNADLEALVTLCKDSGAGYVVMTTKHHDGFALWPTSLEHPVKGEYHAQRDLVGDLTDAVRSEGMKMGLYYSGGYDWPYNGALIKSAADTILAVPASKDYANYATAHVEELIDRYKPSVLWNDICWPPGDDLPELFAYYYNQVEDGVINDRWLQPTMPRNTASEMLIRGIGGVVQSLWKVLPEKARHLTFPSKNHYDFKTPEYESYAEIKTEKWEATRGVGHSFGSNRNERPEDIISSTELIRSFVDVISKNGNLLIGIGPEPDGSIPSEQRAPLAGLGQWMKTNREAVVGTRPWSVANGESSEETPVRFTSTDNTLYAFLLESPGVRDFTFRKIEATNVDDVSLVGLDEPIDWRIEDGSLRLSLPERLPVSPAHAIRITPSSGIRPL